MGKITINALVEGGKATPAPPLAPQLAEAKVKNIQEVISEINKKTENFKGMQVPVKVIVDTNAKTFEIFVGLPPSSALIKKELGLTENVKEEVGVKGKKIIGNLSFEQIVKIAKIKSEESLAKTLKASVKEILGSCLTMGVTVDNSSPKEVIKKVEKGEHDSGLV